MKNIKKTINSIAREYADKFDDKNISLKEIKDSGFVSVLRDLIPSQYVDIGMAYIHAPDCRTNEGVVRFIQCFKNEVYFVCGAIVSSFLSIVNTNRDNPEIREWFVFALNELERITGEGAYTLFWGKENEYEYMSNFYRCEFVVDNVKYHFSEQYMMAQKAKLFNDYEIYNLIMRADNPKECKALGRKVSGFDSDIWDANKYEIVKNGVTAKFVQNPDLMFKLIETGNTLIAEASPYDRIWGIGMNAKDANEVLPDEWKGKNLLGKILMEVRDNIGYAKPEYKKLMKGLSKHSFANKGEIKASKMCGCYFCINTFTPDMITDWLDEPSASDKTALCPECGIDAVIGDKSGMPVTDKMFLIYAHRYYFCTDIVFLRH